MKIVEIKNNKLWQDFFSEKIVDKTFLQSWDWGEFNKKQNNKIWRLGIFENEKLLAVALVIKVRAKRGTFLLIQHGPCLVQSFDKKYQLLKILVNQLKKIAKKEKADFIRMNPLWQRNQENKKIIKEIGFRTAPIHANAYESTWKLDISSSEEKILKNMRKTTRYLIRQAQKIPEIKILKSDKIEDIEDYNLLNQQVAKYRKFVPFSSLFVKNQFNSLSNNNQILLFLAKYNNQTIASALVVFWQGIAFYHQAALSPKYHKIPASYLMQWEIIREAKKRNCYFYDFWGYTDPEKNKNHPWAGPSLFKRGFGGKAYYYLKTQDLPLSYKYWFIFLFEKIRKIKRNL